MILPLHDLQEKEHAMKFLCLMKTGFLLAFDVLI